MRFVDIVEDESVSEELDELTGLRQRVIIEDREKKLHPHIEIVQAKGGKEKRVRDFVIPVGAQLTVEDGQKIFAGTDLAKVGREAYKTRDITGGLPRVAELFEARRPKDPATISEVDGVVRFGEIKRGKREIYVQPVHADGDAWSVDETQEAQLYEVPAGKHLRVHEGDRVRAGDRLSEGPVNPHDILRIKGPRAVQEYLLNEVQEVYRLQGVKINDKHIGVIVRQMLQKVRILGPGDTEFLEGEHVDKQVFRDENDRAKKKKDKPATAEPLLLGITKASLTTQSFISAASLPGDHARAHRRGDPRGQGRPPRPQGEHHHRSPDPGRHGHVPVPVDRDGRGAAGRVRGAPDHGRDAPRRVRGEHRGGTPPGVAPRRGRRAVAGSSYRTSRAARRSNPAGRPFLCTICGKDRRGAGLHALTDLGAMANFNVLFRAAHFGRST